MGINQKGHHKGNTTEDFLNKEVILRELNILPGQTIIDVGCGNGYMSREFSKLVQQSGKVFALDRAKEAIERIKKETKGTNIEPVEADITKKTPIDEKSVDLIYLSTVFHIFTKEQIEGFQKEAKRLLKSNGKLAIIEIQKENTPFGPPLDMRFSPEELKQAIKLKPISFIKVGQYFYMQLFENNKE
ncbi:MAG: class I SAM-dependent methyltransferase [Candidatus Thorarchaeota archaeon]